MEGKISDFSTTFTKKWEDCSRIGTSYLNVTVYGQIKQ